MNNVSLFMLTCMRLCLLCGSFMTLLYPGHVAAETSSAMDDYHALIFTDNSRQPAIDLLGWASIIEDHRSVLSDLGFYSESLAWLSHKLDRLSKQGMGVLPVEVLGLVEIIIRRDKIDSSEYESRLNSYLLTEGSRRMDQLEPLLNSIRISFQTIRSSKEVCMTSSAGMDDVKAIVMPYVKDDWTSTLIEQLMMTSDYDVIAYARNIQGVVKLPKEAEVRLSKYANPDKNCMNYSDMAAVMSHLMEVMPPATSMSYYRRDIDISHQTQAWFEFVDKLLDIHNIKLTELAQRQELIKRLLKSMLPG